jgi:hypothetical protein
MTALFRPGAVHPVDFSGFWARNTRVHGWTRMVLVMQLYYPYFGTSSWAIAMQKIACNRPWTLLLICILHYW